MKKGIFSLALALALATGIAAGAPVNAKRAATVARNFMQHVAPQTRWQPVDITASTPYAHFYVFSLGDKGFVLVAGDDRVRPILGYSLDQPLVCKDMPKHVSDWFEAYDTQIATAAKKQGNGGKASAMWQQLEAGTAVLSSSGTSVEPLLSTTWNQSPYYNNKCPIDNNYNQRSVTGCVATATAQIMKYWNHPQKGYGSHGYKPDNCDSLAVNFGQTTYNWTAMPNQLTASSNSAAVNAVATLMLHIGVAVEMDYSCYSSGASNYNQHGTSMPSSQQALMSYFRYKPDMSVVKLDDMPLSAFCAMLRSELDKSRPILYSGHGQGGGHSFVIDGYDQDGLFHVNWGWGGYCDGYFPIGGLDPDAGGIGGNSESAYNGSNAVLLGIEPNPDFGSGGTVSASASGNGSVSGAGTYAFNSNVTLTATTNEGYRFVQWNDGDHFNPRNFLMNGGDYSFTAQIRPVAGDTLTYCAGNEALGWGSYGSTSVWGIRIPSGSIGSGQKLEAVEFYTSEWDEGTYTVTVMSGTTSPTTQLFSKSVSVGEEQLGTWVRVDLASPTDISGKGNIWIKMSTSDVDWPATRTYYCGNTDGSLYGSTLSSKSTQYSFMIRALMHVEQPSAYHVSATPSDPAMGSVSGGGDYAPGTFATLTASANPGFHFEQWDNGATDNPYYITVSKDTAVVALFVADPDTTHPADTIVRIVHDTITIHDTIAIHDTITLRDTLSVHDTLTLFDTVFVPHYVHDTLTLVDTLIRIDTLVVNTIDTLLQHDTTYVDHYIHDTLRLFFTDTLTLHDTTFVDHFIHDTIYQRINYYVHDTVTLLQIDTVPFFDTVLVDRFVHDTVVQYVPQYIHDTSVVVQYVHDTIIQYVNHYLHDTTFVNNYIHDTVVQLKHQYIHDTTYINVNIHDTVVQYVNQYVHDTTYVNVNIHDTIVQYVNQYVHDTTYVNVNIHDTVVQYVNQYVHDTTYINQNIHDTVIQYVNQYVHDTTYINNYIHDTVVQHVSIPVHDTTFVTTTIVDTLVQYVNHYIHDTAFVYNYIHDTTYLDRWHYDTVTITLPGLHDTLYLHDTIVEPMPFADVVIASSNAEKGLCAGNGHFPVGTLVEIAAVPLEGYHFIEWSDGSTLNPRSITVEADLYLFATFSPDDVAIDQAGTVNWNAYAEQGAVVVQGEQLTDVQIYDEYGRLLQTYSSNAYGIRFEVPASGVYFVRVAHSAARRVVVIR